MIIGQLCFVKNYDHHDVVHPVDPEYMQLSARSWMIVSNRYTDIFISLISEWSSWTPKLKMKYCLHIINHRVTIPLLKVLCLLITVTIEYTFSYTS